MQVQMQVSMHAPHHASPPSMMHFDQPVVQFAANTAASVAVAAPSLSPRKRSAASMIDEPPMRLSSDAAATYRPTRAPIQVQRSASTENGQRGSSHAPADGFALAAAASSSSAAHVPSSRFFTATNRITRVGDAPSKRRRRTRSASVSRRALTAAATAVTAAQPRGCPRTHGSKRKGRASDDADDESDGNNHQVEQIGISEAALECSPQLNGHRWVSEAYSKKRAKIDGPATKTAAAAAPPLHPPADREPDDFREAEESQLASASAIEDVQVDIACAEVAAAAAHAVSADASSDDSMLSALSISSSRSSSPTIASAVSVSTATSERDLQLPPCPLRRNGDCCPTADLLRRQNQQLRFMLEEEKGLRQKAERELAQLQHQQRRASGAATSFVSGPLSPAQNLYGATTVAVGHTSSDDSDYLSPASFSAPAVSSSRSSTIPSRGSFLPSSAAAGAVPFNWLLDRPPQRFIPYCYPNGLPLSCLREFGPM